MTATREDVAKTKLPKGVNIETRMLAPEGKHAFGFIYLHDETRVGWTTDKDGNVELWVGNWGTPTTAGIRAAGMAAEVLCARLPWEPQPTWKWKV